MSQRWFRRPWFWLIVLVACQYAVLQLLTNAQYFDAPRNMQWGLFVLEQPRFLLDTENTYDRINGFAPNPRELAPAGMANGRSTPLHPWWGPVYLGLFALTWGLTHSFTLLRLVVPLAAGATVIMTYLFGRRFFSERIGVTAALLLAFFPNFREMGTIAMVEPISALLLLGALWAFLEGRAWVAALLGLLAALGKVDMIAIYLGMVGLMAVGAWWDSRNSASGQRLPHLRMWLVALLVPLLIIGPWLIVIYGVYGRPTTAGGGPQIEVFTAMLPLMIQQIFTIEQSLTLVGLIIIFGLAITALVRWRRTNRQVVRALGCLLLLGLVVVFGYMTLPGSSNNPRVFIPALPALFLLVALGLALVGRRTQIYGLALVLILYLCGNISGVLYQIIEGRVDSGLQPVWAVLRYEPPGVVLTEHYWDAALYARQPTTWFENDATFQQNILQHEANFQDYLKQAPIRYIVLPQADSEYAALQHDPLVQLYAQLPFGRALNWEPGQLVAPEVRDYLNVSFPKRAIGAYDVYTIR
ncbi:MAG: hypothetical protein SH847_21810 [Roseiflexaceae bacterium]|nr:hypothetical protein [Roseiflexaceae bacterium]